MAKASEYDYWKIFPRMPKKVTIGDITIRDGFQHEEKFVSTEAKIFYGQELTLETIYPAEKLHIWLGSSLRSRSWRAALQ